MELWKPVPGWEERYEVSDQGRVRSIDRTIVVTAGPKAPFSFLQRGKVLRAGISKNGYPLVGLSRQDEGTFSRYVHHLVTEAFLGPRPDGLEVCHNNGIRSDNRLTNLRYGTRSENSMDRHLHGTVNAPKGEDNAHAKLTDEAVRWIRRNNGVLTHRAMGQALGVAHNTVGCAARRTAWRHVQ